MEFGLYPTPFAAFLVRLLWRRPYCCTSVDRTQCERNLKTGWVLHVSSRCRCQKNPPPAEWTSSPSGSLRTRYLKSREQRRRRLPSLNGTLDNTATLFIKFGPICRFSFCNKIHKIKIKVADSATQRNIIFRDFIASSQGRRSLGLGVPWNMYEGSEYVSTP